MFKALLSLRSNGLPDVREMPRTARSHLRLARGHVFHEPAGSTGPTDGELVNERRLRSFVFHAASVKLARQFRRPV